MSETILVPGATGTVGSHLVAELHKRGVSPRIAVRAPESTLTNSPVPWPTDPGGTLDTVGFDFGRPETWGEALSGVQRAFLLYPPGVSVGRITDFVDAAARTGVEHIAFLSILGAGKLPVLPHRRIERHLLGSPLSQTFLRASYFMQNLTEIHLPEIVARDEIFIPAGNGRVGLVDARDVGAVAATVLTDPQTSSRTIEVTGPESLGFSSVAEAFSEVLDREITYADTSIPAFALRMYRRDIDPGLIALMIAEYTVMRLGLSARTTSDVSRVLDREPRSIDEFARSYRDTFEPH